MIGHVGGGAFRARMMTQLHDILSNASPKGVIYDQGLRYAMRVAKPSDSDAPPLAEFVQRYEGGFASDSTKPPSEADED